MPNKYNVYDICMHICDILYVCMSWYPIVTPQANISLQRWKRLKKTQKDKSLATISLILYIVILFKQMADHNIVLHYCVTRRNRVTLVLGFKTYRIWLFRIAWSDCWWDGPNFYPRGHLSASTFPPPPPPQSRRSGYSCGSRHRWGHTGAQEPAPSREFFNLVKLDAV